MRVSHYALLCVTTLVFVTSANEAGIVIESEKSGSAGGGEAILNDLGFDMIPFAQSTLVDFEQLTAIDTPIGGQFGMSPEHEARTVGDSWGSWSGGYEGNILWTIGETESVYTMPEETAAFDFHIEPNPFTWVTFDIAATGSKGSVASGTVTAVGQKGAALVAIYGTDGETITDVSVSGNGIDYAIGEMRISCGAPARACGSTDNGADFDGDGIVGPADLALLLGAWGTCPGARDCPTDLDGDDTVGPADLALLLGAWG